MTKQHLPDCNFLTDVNSLCSCEAHDYSLLTRFLEENAEAGDLGLGQTPRFEDVDWLNYTNISII